LTKKEELRRTFLDIRRKLPEEVAAARSAAIMERVISLDEVRDASVVLTYVSSKDNEVDTTGLIKRLLGNSVDVFVPIAGPQGELVWSRIESLDELERGRFGILEPRRDCRRLSAPPPSTGPVLVPGVAFSPAGYRIGYGGGYFDRFLAGYNGAGIGLAFQCQVLPELPADPHDVPVDIVVTEQKNYHTR